MKCIIIISIIKVKKLDLEKLNNLLKVREVKYLVGCFLSVKLEKVSYSLFRNPRKWELLWLLNLKIPRTFVSYFMYLTTGRSDFILYTKVTSEM